MSEPIVACFGDSILAGWSNEHPGCIDAWDVYLGQAFNLDNFKVGIGGAGFSCGTVFSSMIDTMVQNIENAGRSTDEVVLVVLGGGINDARNEASDAAVKIGTINFLVRALEAFPKAQIHIFPMIMGNCGCGTKVLGLESAVRDGCLSIGMSNMSKIVFHGGAWTWNYDGNDSGVSADRIHLLTDGEKRVGASMAIEINGGSAYNEERWFPVYDINGNIITGGTRRGSMVSFSLATNITSAGNNVALGVDKRYGFKGGCASVSNENQNGSRIFFYRDDLACWCSYLPLSNSGCYGLISHGIESVV